MFRVEKIQITDNDCILYTLCPSEWGIGRFKPSKKNFTLRQTSKDTSLMMSPSADFSVGSSQAFGYDNNGHRPKTSTSSSAEHTATDRYRIEKAG